MNYESIIAAAMGLGIVFLLVPLILRISRRATWLERSPEFHHGDKAPVPRVGGIALAGAFIAVELFIAIFSRQPGDARQHFVIVATSLAMFALGLWDDLRPLGAKKKLIGQVLLALVVCSFGIGIQTFKVPFTGQIIELGAWGVVITVLWLVAMTNLINLIDGVDGLAGGICLMLMVLLVYVGHQHGNVELMASGMAGALFGFLWFNFPPARIYMGDGGAYFLGFQIGLFAIISSQKGTIFAALVAPLFVLALPIADTALAIVRRGLRGLPIFRPDRRHIHHRLIALGFSRQRVVLLMYAFTLMFMVLGLVAFWSRGQLLPTLLGIAALILLYCAGRLGSSQGWLDVGRVVGDSLGSRREIQYALSLTRWLAQEGSRPKPMDGLWSDLIFVAQRLGFSCVKLTLAQGERVWEQPGMASRTRSVRHELQGGRCGILELTAPVCTERNNQHRASRALASPKVFEIVSELLAEGWSKAVRTQRSKEEGKREQSDLSALIHQSTNASSVS